MNGTKAVPNGLRFSVLKRKIFNTPAFSPSDSVAIVLILLTVIISNNKTQITGSIGILRMFSFFIFRDAWATDQRVLSPLSK